MNTYDEERAVLEKLQALFDKEAAAGKKLKDAQKALGAKVSSKFGQLTAEEVKVLVVDDKWLVHLTSAVGRELDRVSHALTSRIHQLADRYSAALPEVSKDLIALAVRVEEHLRKMGMPWR